MLSAEPTLKAFYERLLPFADAFMALFGRHSLPSRSALSRFLAALDPVTVEALRTLFQKDLVARKPFASPGGLWDRSGSTVGGGGCGWNQTSSTSASAPAVGDSPRATASFCSGLSSQL